MAWHLGYPLSQTLFTSVYLESIVMPAPDKIADAWFTRVENDHAHKDRMLFVLRAYCLGLLKACWYVNERIKFEHYYEVSSASQTDEALAETMAGRGLCHKHIPPCAA